MLERTTIEDREYYILRHEPLDVIEKAVADAMFDNPRTLQDILSHPKCTPGMAALIQSALQGR